jgi:hypothetical protein
MIGNLDVAQLGEFGILGVLVFILWRKLESHQKGISDRLEVVQLKLDECEEDRFELRGRLSEIEKRVI